MVFFSLSCLLAMQILGQIAPAVLTSVSGDVSIIRAQDSVAITARAMDHLFGGDSVVASDGQATVFYLTGKFTVIPRHTARLLTLLEADTARMTGTEHAVIDVDIKIFHRLFVIDNGTENAALEKIPSAANDTLMLIIHAPGNTALRSNRPDVVWSYFPGANWYAVTIEQRGRVVNSIATTDTFVSYPQQHDSLAAGSYVLRVCAFHNNDSLCSEERYFQVLTPDVIAEIEKRIDKIARTCPEAYTARLLTALIYEKYDLKTDAIDTYTRLLSNTTAGFVHRALALLYSSMGKPRMARHHYNIYTSADP